MDGRLSQAVPGWQRGLALVGGLTFLACALSCMSLNFGRTESAQATDAHAQSGTITIPAQQTLEVFYPNPYVSTPNLTVENSWNDCKIVEQKADRFRIHNPAAVAREITWKTRGEKLPTEVLLQNAKAGSEKASGSPPALSIVSAER